MMLRSLHALVQINQGEYDYRLYVVQGLLARQLLSQLGSATVQFYLLTILSSRLPVLWCISFHVLPILEHDRSTCNPYSLFFLLSCLPRPKGYAQLYSPTLVIPLDTHWRDKLSREQSTLQTLNGSDFFRTLDFSYILRQRVSFNHVTHVAVYIYQIAPIS